MAGPPPMSEARTATAREDKPGGIKGMVASAKQTFERLRDKYGWLDHAVRAFQHFSKVQSNMLAGAVTYFGMLSIFPIIALAFAVAAFVARVDADAQDQIMSGLRDMLPGLFDKLTSDQLTSAAGAASIIGVLGFLYSGLGWLSALRTALQAAFEVPKRAKRNFVLSKVFDLISLATIGLILVTSVATSSVVTGLTTTILNAIGLGSDGSAPWLAKILVWLLGIALGVAASTLLFFVIFRILANPVLKSRSLWEGALFSAVGFEILKLLATYLIKSASSNPVYGSFAITVALLAWINYFARVTMLGAAWAVTTKAPGAGLDALKQAPMVTEPKRDEAAERARSSVVSGAVMGAAAMAFVGLLKRIRNDNSDV